MRAATGRGDRPYARGREGCAAPARGGREGRQALCAATGRGDRPYARGREGCVAPARGDREGAPGPVRGREKLLHSGFHSGPK